MALEPLLDIHSIQGNILAGFNKDYQVLIGIEITDLAANRVWLANLTPHIATLFEVLSFNRLFKAVRAKRGGDVLQFERNLDQHRIFSRRHREADFTQRS